MTFISWRGVVLTALTTLTLLTLTACGSSPKNKVAEAPRAPIKSVALIPAINTKLNFEYSASLFVPPVVRGVLSNVHASRGEANAKLIQDKLAAEGYDISKRLTEQVVKQLQDSGLVVEVLSNVERKPGDPNDIDYTKVVHKSDAIMHLYFNELMYQSPRGQSAYWPRVSATLVAYDKTGKTDLFEANTYLDRGAKESKSGYFDAKDDLSFPEQDDMVSETAKVRVAFEHIATQAAQYLGKRAVELSH